MLAYGLLVGTHRDPLARLTVSEWLRYRRLLRAMTESAWRNGEPLTADRRTSLKAEARAAARTVR